MANDRRPDDMQRITTPELADAFIAEQIEALRAQRSNTNNTKPPESP